MAAAMASADAFKPRWADVMDSSQEDLREDSSRAAARGLVEEGSYRGEDSAPGLGSLREEFSRCARAISSCSSSRQPLDFSFLLDGTSPLPQLWEEQASSQASPDAAGRSGTTGGGLGSKRGSRRKRRQGGPHYEKQPGSPLKRARSQQVATDATEEARPEGTEDWRHRVEKRGRAVEMIKATPDYQAYALARRAADRLDGEPRTPEAQDRSVSKRRWEQEVQQWRVGLRQWCQFQERGAPAEAEGAPSPAAAAAAARSPGDGPGARAYEYEAPQRRQPSVLEMLQRRGRS